MVGLCQTGGVARRPSKHLRPPRPLGSGYARATELDDGRWLVRDVPGAGATKPYRCPGCSQVIPPGTPHVVAWPAESSSWGSGSPVAERRHWHTGCWNRRR